MTAMEALLASRAQRESPQPEGREVADLYRSGQLQSMEEALYLIAYLLREANSRD